MRTIAVIPARMGSSRFPGKPLARIAGRPMIEHVYRATAACALLDDVVIATCDDAIAQAAQAFGARVCRTSSAHERASDRVAEACRNETADIVVMVQGDEPMIRPEMINASATGLLDDPSAVCVNLMAPIRSEEELRDANTIKVVVDHQGQALYFSRVPIPSVAIKPFDTAHSFKQVCVISFRRSTLLEFATLPQGPLEQAESVDMLRFLEHGIAVRMVRTDIETQAVDTPADLARVEALLANQSVAGL
jgi:3-deoxy-manno-octulosonate cytidylyltransferase (CMP-KDO synthetase)